MLSEIKPGCKLRLKLTHLMWQLHCLSNLFYEEGGQLQRCSHPIAKGFCDPHDLPLMLPWITSPRSSLPGFLSVKLNATLSSYFILQKQTGKPCQHSKVEGRTKQHLPEAGGST